MLELELPKKLRKAVEREAESTNQSVNALIIKHLERAIPAYSNSVSNQTLEKGMEQMVKFLNSVPSVNVIFHDVTPDSYWWIKLDIDISHHLAWNVVQELGFVLNYISLQEPLPTVFKPVSPPPYLNGGPSECLSWVIEPTAKAIDTRAVSAYLEQRLPQPVNDENAWIEE